MSAITEKIAAEHVPLAVPGPRLPWDLRRVCSCGASPDNPDEFISSWRIRHIAEVTEAAVREQVAADLLAVDPMEWALAGMASGMDAAQIARGVAP